MLTKSLQDEFFIVDGQLVLPTYCASTTDLSDASPEPQSRFRSSPSDLPILVLSLTPSRTTEDTFLVPDVHHAIPLHDLFHVINRHRSLQHARILQADSYKQWNGRVTHRFIVLELERDGREKIWLRIDRGRDPNGGFLHFFTHAGTAIANDEVSLSVRFPTCSIAE